MNVQLAFSEAREAGWDVKLERVRHAAYNGEFQSVTLRSPRCSHCGNQHLIVGTVAPGISSNGLQMMAAGMRNQWRRHLNDGCRY